MCRRNIQICTGFRCLYGLRSRQVLFSGGSDGGEHVLGVSGKLGCGIGELILDAWSTYPPQRYSMFDSGKNNKQHNHHY